MMTAKLKEVAAREVAAIAIAGAGAGGWAPSSAALAPGTGTPTGAYGQGLVWDPGALGGRGASVYPWEVGGGNYQVEERSQFQQAFDLYRSGDLSADVIARLAAMDQSRAQPITVNVQIDRQTIASAVIEPWMTDQLTTGALQHGVVN